MRTDLQSIRIQGAPGAGTVRMETNRIRRVRAFTIVELLVVISIIALLASLTVGLSSIASRKSKESRMQGELNKLVTAIESYHAAIGSYPRDNPFTPAVNQLYYELSGTYFSRSGNQGFFSLPNRDQRMSSRAVEEFFHAPGFANSVSVDSGDKPKYTEEFKPEQVKRINQDPAFEVLVAPVKGPGQFTHNGRELTLAMKSADGTMVNPWLYDSSSAQRNNRESYDLWAVVVIGKNLVRFSNWESIPTDLGPAR
ncbi:MAG: type II secretion system GspH family protein [Verrucomicrobia bacterium]|nr:type II secretion system GspH family protein [Verrucomicrobiota bacterium]